MKWKECTHPWYVFYHDGKEINPKTGKVRERGLRCKLATLVGREPISFADAKAEARRAITAWQDGRDARALLPGDPPTLAAVLDGYGTRPYGVFGDEVGRRRGSIKTAWRLTCQRAKIDGLHFHDLRREAGSRWMDAGVPLATIQRWLGHHNISQTSTYLAASGGGDGDAMRAFEQATGRLPQIAALTGSTGSEPTRSDTGAIENTQSNAIGHNLSGVVH